MLEKGQGTREEGVENKVYDGFRAGWGCLDYRVGGGLGSGLRRV